MNSEDNVERFVQPRSGRVLAGLILVGIGSVLLGREMGLDIPEWLLTWQTLIIALGLFFGARRMFRAGGWLIMVAVGSGFLLADYFPELGLRQMIWPIAIILFGLWMILRPRRTKWDKWEWKPRENFSGDSYTDANSVFGGTKKKIVSKEFKGGEINSVFGESDLDLSQADFTGSATLSVNVVFGGAKLIVPPHWKIQSDVDCVFGTVQDKRHDSAEVSDKTLILKGSVVFGGIEIKSY